MVERGNEEDYGSQLRRRRRFRTMAIGNGGDGGGSPILVQTRSGVEYSFALHMDQAWAAWLERAKRKRAWLSVPRGGGGLCAAYGFELRAWILRPSNVHRGEGCRQVLLLLLRSPCEKENRNKASVAGYAKVSLIRTVFFFLSPFRWISIRTGFSCH